MTFTEWIFLLGGLAAVGPVIAHLLAKPRFRRVPFTMLRFLEAGQAESRSRRKLRDLLMLLVRCAIIVLIAMLFARPLVYRKSRPEHTGSVYYLGLDNSMSMAYSDGSDSYFERMIDSAVRYIRSADDKGLFNLCGLASADWANDLGKAEALAEVRRFKVTPVGADIDGFLSVVGRDAARANRIGAVSVMILSDFTPNTLRQFDRVYEPAVVDNVDYRPITSSRAINNAAVVDAHVLGVAGGTVTLNVTVANCGQIEQSRRLTASIESHTSAPVQISLAPNQRRVCQVRMDIDASVRGQPSLPVQLSLSEGDGLKEDDTFRLAVSVPQHKNIRVLLAEAGHREMFLLETAIDALSRSGSYGAFETRRASIGNLAASDLDWADVVVCSTIAQPLRSMAEDFRDFVNAGGRAVFFMTSEPSPEAVNQLWKEGVLAAFPGRCVLGQTYIEPKPEETGLFDARGAAARALSNYRIDKIVLKGYFESRQHPDSRCLWRLQNGAGFVHLRFSGSGAAVLVNTSVDDSLGSVTKSNAAVAFCRYILGDGNQLAEYCFASDQKVVLPVPAVRTSGLGNQFPVQTCDGRRHLVTLRDSVLAVPDPGGIGWVKTLETPALYAGVNLPPGETDMTGPDGTELAGVMNRAFARRAQTDIASARVGDDERLRPLWKIFAWTIIILLLAEPALANRLKR